MAFGDKVNGVEVLKKLSDRYLEKLTERAKHSRAYRDYQLIGLQLAEILHDRPHRALFIKLAKEYNQEKLMELAGKIAERDNIRNKGAYFMRVFHADPNYRKKGK